LKDSLNKALKKFTVDPFEIVQVSMNLIGTKIINHSSGFFIVPQMELLINCKSEVSIQKILSSPELIAYFDYSLSDNYLLLQKEKLYFKQITPTSFYLGINEYPDFESVHGDNLILVEGSLKPLTNIEGGGMMKSVLQMMPIYQASNKLAAHTDKIELSLSLNGHKTAELKGNLSFSEGNYPLNELVKFLLMGQLLQ
jgi:hypothetical protein